MGSGPAAISAIWALNSVGITPTVIDSGEILDEKTNQKIVKYKENSSCFSEKQRKRLFYPDENFSNFPTNVVNLKSPVHTIRN